MFVFTLRRGGMRRLAVAAICGVVLAGAAFAANTVHGKAVATAAQGGGPLTQEIADVQDVTAFFQGFGLTVDASTAQVSTVTVPRKWDENFKAFNEVIRDCGLDLSRVKNKKIDKWVVLIPDKSKAEEKSYGVLLVYKNEPKGAYILKKPSGEVLSLKEAAKETSLALTDEEIEANAGFGEELAQTPAEDGVAPAEAPAEGEAAPVDAAEPAPAEDVPVQAEVEFDPNGFPTD